MLFPYLKSHNNCVFFRTCTHPKTCCSIISSLPHEKEQTLIILSSMTSQQTEIWVTVSLSVAFPIVASSFSFLSFFFLFLGLNQPSISYHVKQKEWNNDNNIAGLGFSLSDKLIILLPRDFSIS